MAIKLPVRPIPALYIYLFSILLKLSINRTQVKFLTCNDLKCENEKPSSFGLRNGLIQLETVTRLDIIYPAILCNNNGRFQVELPVKLILYNNFRVKNRLF